MHSYLEFRVPLRGQRINGSVDLWPAIVIAMAALLVAIAWVASPVDWSAIAGPCYAPIPR
jgi:hypothetical protein